MKKPYASFASGLTAIGNLFKKGKRCTIILLVLIISTPQGNLDMDGGFVFTSDKIQGVHEAFSEYGFVRITSVFGQEEIQSLVNEVERVKSQSASLPKNIVWFSPSLQKEDEYIIQRISRINHFSKAINDFGHNNTYLHQVTAMLLGVDFTRFADGYEGSDGSVLVVKDPNNASVHSSLRWHLDGSFTKHLPINPFVNLGIYLDDAGFDKGGLVVAPRSHRFPSAFDTNLSETTEYYKGEICVAANKGDIVVHSSELWHCSRQYTAFGGVRRVLYFNYFPDPA